MKKFIFTAIAMVAFVGSSMANTIDVDKEKSQMVRVTKRSDVAEPSDYDKAYCTGKTDGKEEDSMKAGSKPWTYTKWKASYDKCISERQKVQTIN